MNYAVKTYQYAPNPKNIPASWIAEIVPLKLRKKSPLPTNEAEIATWTEFIEEDVTPPSGPEWVIMTGEQLIAYKALYAAEYQAWQNLNPIENVSTLDFFSTNVSSESLTLFNCSPTINVFDGTTCDQNIVLPDATTCYLGKTFKFINRSTRSLNLQVNAPGIGIITSVTLGSFKTTEAILISNSNTAGIWEFSPLSWFTSDNTLTSTNSNSYINKISLTAKIPNEGTYRISWNYNWSYSSTSRNFLARVRIGSSATVHSHAEEIKETLNQSIPISGFYSTYLAASNHTFTLEYATSNLSDTAYMSNARLEVTKM